MTGVYYNRLPLDSFSKLNMALFFLIVILLSILAVRMFIREKPESN